MINVRDYNKIKDALEQLEKQLFLDVMSVSEVMTEDGIRIKEVPYGSRETVLEDTSTWEIFKHGASWGEPDTHYCFHVAVEIPEIYRC